MERDPLSVVDPLSIDELLAAPSVSRGEERLAAYLWEHYHITPKQYNAMLKAQDGRCGICRGLSKRRYHVDHDHGCCPGKISCGKCVRGLLCINCNQYLLGRVCHEVTRGKSHAVATLERAISWVHRAGNEAVL